MDTNNNTVTFTSSCGKFIFTVKKSWYDRFEYATKNYDVYFLNTKYELYKYLHNPIGPAIVYLETGRTACFIDGKHLNEEDSRRLVFNNKFTNNFLDRLNEEENS